MRVIVGRIGRPHGIRGEVTVEPRTDEPGNRFAPGAVLHLQPTADDPRDRTLTVEGMHWHSGRLLLAFEEILDRKDAEGVRNRILEVERGQDEQPEDPDEYYDSALIDCQVRLAGGPAIGTVTEVLHLPGQDMLAISDLNGREVLIPFVEAIVPSVDIRAKVITITPPPGLLDEVE